MCLPQPFLILNCLWRRLEQSIPDGYREFSFLWKPEAKEVNASKLTVIICKVDSRFDGLR